MLETRGQNSGKANKPECVFKKIDLLKIDTEGYEFQVLQGLRDKLNNVHLVHFEHHFDDMIIKDYKLTDIHNLLISNGFEKKFKIKMKFRKTFEYIYENKKLFKI